MADNTAYGPTPSVGMADFQAVTYKEYHTEAYTNASGTDIPAGGVVVVNGMVLVAVGGIANGASGTLTYLEAFSVVKDSSTFAQNDPVYWAVAGNPVNRTAGTGAMTSSTGGTYLAGFALAAAVTGAERVLVSLRPMNGTSVSVVNQLTNVIADPGASGAIPVTVGGYCPIVTAGAETRTLAAPTFVGQQILLTCQTKVGNAVVTVATTVNATGNNTITFSAAGQSVMLVAKANGSNIRWSVVSNDGAALTTV